MGKDRGSSTVIVAVIDTGIDYNHKNLRKYLKNPGEIPNNRKDDDGNGYVDGVYGWDFCNNTTAMDGNRHGTRCGHHCGHQPTTASSGRRSLEHETRGKFLSDRGWGSVSDAIDAVAYCTTVVPNQQQQLGRRRFQQSDEAIDRAGQNGHLFCAAAGNSALTTTANLITSSYLG